MAEVTQVAEQRAASLDLEKSGLDEALQRARAILIEKANAVLQERVKKAMKKKNRFTARCDDLALESQRVFLLGDEEKKSHEPCVEIQLLK